MSGEAGADDCLFGYGEEQYRYDEIERGNNEEIREQWGEDCLISFCRYADQLLCTKISHDVGGRWIGILSIVSFLLSTMPYKGGPDPIDLAPVARKWRRASGLLDLCGELHNSMHMNRVIMKSLIAQRSEGIGARQREVRIEACESAIKMLTAIDNLVTAVAEKLEDGDASPWRLYASDDLIERYTVRSGGGGARGII